MKKLYLAFVMLFLIGCNAEMIDRPKATALPGWWTALVTDLLLSDKDLPNGWERIRDWPKGSLSDLTINQVYRSWWNPSENCCKVEQSIWRNYSINDAISWYAGKRQDSFGVQRTPTPPSVEIYTLYEPPEGFHYQSKIADEYYYACGWSSFPRCVILSRYRNYVAIIIVNWQTTGPDSRLRSGATIAQLEQLFIRQDEIFGEFLKANSINGTGG